MIHLQQKGTPVGEIAYGLCLAMARNFMATVIRGRQVVPPLALVGGGAANKGLVRAFAEVLGLDAESLRISPNPGGEGAVGAALSALECERDPRRAVGRRHADACAGGPQGAGLDAARPSRLSRAPRRRSIRCRPRGPWTLTSAWTWDR